MLNGEKVDQSRWIVPANGSQMLVVQFQSEDMGTFRENLVFEVCSTKSLINYKQPSNTLTSTRNSLCMLHVSL